MVIFFHLGIKNHASNFSWWVWWTNVHHPACFMVEARSVEHKHTPNIYTGGIWNLGEHSSAPALLSKHRVIEIFKYFIIKCVPVHNILLYNSWVTFDPVLFLPWIPIFSQLLDVNFSKSIVSIYIFLFYS